MKTKFFISQLIYKMITLRLFYLLFLLSFQLSSALTKNPSIIIIGAGPAGIAAATKLLENSITNITILEAENRIGGRIYSVKFGDGFVEVGAEFCHGQQGNTVYEMVKDLDLLEHSKNYSLKVIKVYYSNGSTIAPDLAFDLNESLTTYYSDLNTTGRNMGDAFLDKYNSTILRKYSNDEDKYKVASEGIKLLQDSILSNEGAFSSQQISVVNHFVDTEGDQTMTWKTRGYHIILDILMKSYPDPSQKLPIDDKIFLNKKVTQIVWNGSKATVKSSDNSSLTADHVIFTPSIGVLQEQKDTLFQPQLPEEKKDALEAIGFNGVMKIILRFSKKWWTDEDRIFSFLWKNEDLLDIKNEFSFGPSKEGISWVSHIPFVITVPSNPNVLIAWVTGYIVPQVEKTPKDVLLNGCMYVIRKFLGKDYNISNAEDIIRSQWNTNPNFLGTYSYEKAGYFEENLSYNAKLAEPLGNDGGNPTLLFAGEATNPTQYATVGGAISSGRREAERIINLYKNA